MLAVLRLPGVRSLFAFSCLGRLSMGALGLLMIWKLPPWVVVLFAALGGAALGALGR